MSPPFKTSKSPRGPFSAQKAKMRDSITLCMIMRNEQERLPRCLDSIAGLVDEIVIVDTGSTDNSKRTALQRGCIVLEDPWQDDFARPRNIGIDRATKNWILILDPDEVLSLQDHPTIRDHTLHPEVIAYRMDTRNYTNNPWMQGTRANPKDFFAAHQYYGFVPSGKTRLFQNWKGIHFQGVWHELLDYDIRDKKYPFLQSPVPVHHYPHEINQANIQEKRRFYLRMGEKKVRLEPDHDQAWWELAVSEHISGYNRRALRSCLLSLRKGFYRQDRLFFLSSILKALGNKKAQDLVFEKAVCMIYPNLTHIDPSKKIPLHAPQPYANLPTPGE